MLCKTTSKVLAVKLRLQASGKKGTEGTPRTGARIKEILAPYPKLPCLNICMRPSWVRRDGQNPSPELSNDIRMILLSKVTQASNGRVASRVLQVSMLNNETS